MIINKHFILYNVIKRAGSKWSKYKCINDVMCFVKFCIINITESCECLTLNEKNKVIFQILYTV